MRRSFTRGLLVVTAALALLATACGDDDDEGADSETTEAPGAERGNVDGTVVFGHLGPQTGSLSAILPSLTTAVQMVVDEINAAGGLLGKPVTISLADDGSDNANLAQTSYGKLVNTDHIDVLFGPAGSDVVARLTDSIATDKLPTCTGSATAGSLSGTGDGYFYRTAPPDSLQGPALGTLIAGDGRTKTAILARNDDYGSGFATSLEDTLTEAGGTVTESVLYDPNGSNFDGDVQKALDSAPDSVAVIGFGDDGAKIINTMIAKGAGPSQIPIYTADGMQSSKFASIVDPADPSKVAGIRGTAPAASPAGVQSPFQAAFATKGVDPIFSSYYYDCAILMGLAVHSADTDDGSAIAEEFTKHLEGDEDCQTFADCTAFLDDGKTIHYRGASNTFDKWETMEPGTGVYEVWAYDAAGKAVSESADTQIKIGG